MIILEAKRYYGWIIIDGAPQTAKLRAAAVKVADLVLISVRPRLYDIRAGADLVPARLKATSTVRNRSLAPRYELPAGSPA